MDALLDEALDEIDDGNDSEEADGAQHHPRLELPEESDENEVRASPSTSPGGNTRNPAVASTPPSGAKETEPDVPPAEILHALGQLMQGDDGGGDPNEFLGQFMSHLQSQATSPSNASQVENEADTDVETAMAKILEGMANATMDDSSELNEDDFLRGMFQGLQSPGEDFGPDSLNPDAVIDGMMQQLLSKDLMYEPMKQVTEKFPEWLENNKAKISSKDYQQ